MHPFGQGALDCLCGVYGIVNAERRINGTNQEDSKELFKKIILYLEEKEMLSDALTEGMSLKHLTFILNDVVEDRISYKKIAFAGVKNPDLDTFWSRMTTLLDEMPNGVVLLGFERKSEDWGHWTVVDRITPKQIQLFDSMNPDRLKRLNRIHCTTSDNLGRPYILAPARHTYLPRNN
jgi:hypothetical protein